MCVLSVDPASISSLFTSLGLPGPRARLYARLTALAAFFAARSPSTSPFHEPRLNPSSDGWPGSETTIEYHILASLNPPATPRRPREIVSFVAEDVPDAIERLVQAYLVRRESADEPFIAAYRRIGDAPFKEALYGAN